MHRPRAYVLIALLLAAAWSAPPAASAAPAPLPLIPMPASVQRDPGGYALHDGATVAAEGDVAKAGPIARRFIDLVARTRGLHLRRVTAPERADVVLALRTGAVQGREAYQLHIDGHGVRVTASAPAGLYYGTVTLWQLLTPEGGRGATAMLPAVRIADRPRFAWRGLMLDSARHVQRVDQIEQLIDWMSLHKLNVLHWHLTDDQGWRLQIPGYPELTRIGSCRRAVGTDAELTGGKPYCGYYTDTQVRRIVRYAQQHFVTIVPEIDIPGHAQAAIASYPWLGVTGRRPPVSSDWGVHTWLFNPDPRTMRFLEHVLDHVMALFPSRDIHIGGDEAAKDQWQASAAVQAQIRRLGLKDADALQHWMTARLGTYLQAHGRRLVGWDEILGPGLASDAVVMSWHGVSGGLAAARAGHDAVLAPSPVLYLDHLQSDDPREPPGRPQVEGLRDIYDFDPLPATLTAADAHHILGVQANLWTEYMTTFGRDQHAVFPRLAALAEVAWSPADAHDWAGFLARLPAQLARYRRLGIDYARTGFAPQLQAQAAGPAHARVTLPTNIGAGEVHYTLDGRPPTPTSPRFQAAFDVALPTTLRAASFDAAGTELGAMPPTRLDTAWLMRRTSDQLQPCTQTIVLRLGGLRPAHGPRPVYRLNIGNMCWLWTQAPLQRAQAVRVRVGRLPWRFQLWKDDSKVTVRPLTAAGPELVLRRGDCDGPVLARWPLHGIDAAHPRVLAARLPPIADGTLCAYATGDPHDGLWALDRIQLVPRGHLVR